MQDKVSQMEEVTKKETQKSLKEEKGNTNKQRKELNKTILDLKIEVETTKILQRETTLEIENLEKMQISTTEFKRWKKESQRLKIP